MAPPAAGPRQADAAFVEVPYPPPPARTEVVPGRPRDDARWVDGQWQWDGTTWTWEPGGWVVPPAGATFTPWATRRNPDGRLYFAAAQWYDAKGHDIPAPPFIAVAGSGTLVPGAGSAKP